LPGWYVKAKGVRQVAGAQQRECGAKGVQADLIAVTLIAVRIAVDDADFISVLIVGDRIRSGKQAHIQIIGMRAADVPGIKRDPSLVARRRATGINGLVQHRRFVVIQQPDAGVLPDQVALLLIGIRINVRAVAFWIKDLHRQIKVVYAGRNDDLKQMRLTAVRLMGPPIAVLFRRLAPVGLQIGIGLPGQRDLARRSRLHQDRQKNQAKRKRPNSIALFTMLCCFHFTLPKSYVAGSGLVDSASFQRFAMHCFEKGILLIGPQVGSTASSQFSFPLHYRCAHFIVTLVFLF